MKRIIHNAAWAGLLLLLCSNVSLAQEPLGSLTVSFTAPTQNEDGTPLIDLAAYKFYYGTSSGNYSDQIRVDNPGITTYVIENLVPATYYVVATAINEKGIESRFSNEAVKDVLGDAIVPEPPTNLTATGPDLIAYTYAQSYNVFSMYPVGHVPEGTTCDGSMKMNDLYRVDVEDVVFPPDTEATIAFAACGSGS